MKTVSELLLKYNCPKRTQKAKTKIEQIQRILNFNLPNDYLFFLQNYSGFEQFIGPEFVRLWDTDELIGANIDYQIFENLPKTLAIGGNGSSELITRRASEALNVLAIVGRTLINSCWMAKIMALEISKFSVRKKRFEVSKIFE